MQKKPRVPRFFSPLAVASFLNGDRGGNSFGRWRQGRFQRTPLPSPILSAHLSWAWFPVQDPTFLDFVFNGRIEIGQKYDS